MHNVSDRLKESATTTGTGAFTLAGAHPGFLSFATRLTSNGNTTWYCAVNGAEWEIGLGTRTGATTMGRTTVLSSSNGDALVPFTAPPTVFSTMPAAAFKGPAFRANRSATAQTGLANSTYTKVLFDVEEFDPAGCYNPATGRFTPTLPGYYAFSWLVTPSGSSISAISAKLYKNGAAYAEGTWAAVTGGTGRSGSSTLVYLNGTTDYAEVFAYVTAASGHGVAGSAAGDQSYFSGHLARG